MDSFLMIGQSNMAGRGHFNQVPSINNDKCFMLRMGKWAPMTAPVNPDAPVLLPSWHSGISLAESFADEYAKCYDEEVGLIPCAYGGTKIKEWMPGEVLFDHAVMQAKLAMRTSTLKGILWHQGESDCDNENLPLYEERFIKMVETLRKELGNPNLPLVMGEISYDITPSWNMQGLNIKFNELLPSLSEKIGASALAKADGFALNEDGIHFDSPSLREFGKRYFAAYQSIT